MPRLREAATGIILLGEQFAPLSGELSKLASQVGDDLFTVGRHAYPRTSSGQSLALSLALLDEFGGISASGQKRNSGALGRDGVHGSCRYSGSPASRAPSIRYSKSSSRARRRC